MAVPSWWTTSEVMVVVVAAVVAREALVAVLDGEPWVVVTSAVVGKPGVGDRFRVVGLKEAYLQYPVKHFVLLRLLPRK